MQQNSSELRTEQLAVRFGVDLRSTEASYRQALWGANRPTPTDRPLPAPSATAERSARAAG